MSAYRTADVEPPIVLSIGKYPRWVAVVAFVLTFLLFAAPIPSLFHWADVHCTRGDACVVEERTLFHKQARTVPLADVTGTYVAQIGEDCARLSLVTASSTNVPFGDECYDPVVLDGPSHALDAFLAKAPGSPDAIAIDRPSWWGIFALFVLAVAMGSVMTFPLLAVRRITLDRDASRLIVRGGWRRKRETIPFDAIRSVGADDEDGRIVVWTGESANKLAEARSKKEAADAIARIEAVLAKWKSERNLLARPRE